MNEDEGANRMPLPLPAWAARLSSLARTVDAARELYLSAFADHQSGVIDDDRFGELERAWSCLERDARWALVRLIDAVMREEAADAD